MLLRSWPVLYRPHTVPHVSALQSRHGQRPAPWHAGTWQANARITRNHVRDPVGNRRTLQLPLILYDIVIIRDMIAGLNHNGRDPPRGTESFCWKQSLELHRQWLGFGTLGNGKWVDRIGGWMRHNELVVYLIIQYPIVWDFNQQQSKKILWRHLGPVLPWLSQISLSFWWALWSWQQGWPWQLGTLWDEVLRRKCWKPLSMRLVTLQVICNENPKCRIPCNHNLPSPVEVPRSSSLSNPSNSYSQP